MTERQKSKIRTRGGRTGMTGTRRERRQPCGLQDLNLHPLGIEPKSIVSANSTKAACGRDFCQLFYYSGSAVGRQQKSG